MKTYILLCSWFQKESFASFLFNFVIGFKKIMKTCNFIKDKGVSCEYCEIFRSSFLVEHLWWLLLWLLSEECRTMEYRKSVYICKCVVYQRNLCSNEATLGCWFCISCNIFKLIQHNFHVGTVYSVFHPTFHSYDVILNVRNSNFEWSEAAIGGALVRKGVHKNFANFKGKYLCWSNKATGRKAFLL